MAMAPHERVKNSLTQMGKMIVFSEYPQYFSTLCSPAPRLPLNEVAAGSVDRRFISSPDQVEHNRTRYKFCCYLTVCVFEICSWPAPHPVVVQVSINRYIFERCSQSEMLADNLPLARQVERNRTQAHNVFS